MLFSCTNKGGEAVAITWGKEEHAYLKQLADSSGRKQWTKWAEDMSNRFSRHYTSEQIRSYWRTKVRGTSTPFTNDYKKETELLSDGSVKSDRLIAISEEQEKDPQFLLEAHGLDPHEWELTHAKISEWNQHNKEDGTVTLRSCKITAKPKPKEVSDIDIAALFSGVQPIDTELTVTDIGETYLYIPLADFHFGHNTLFDYTDIQADIADTIRNGYEEIVISINGDYLHVDNFLNTTEKGTRVDDVNHIQGVQDGYDFIMPLLKLALESSPNVKLIYLPGNHAPAQDYMLIQGIKRLFPQLVVDDEVVEVKHTWLGKHSLFMHHGDKIKNIKRLLEVAVSKYAKEWGESQSRYLFTAHLHHEKSLSFGGLTHYQLQSPSKPSTYDEQYGYDTSESGVMLYEFDKYKRKAIYYL